MRVRSVNKIGVRLFFGIIIIFLAIWFIVMITSVELSRLKRTTDDLARHHINEVRLLGKLQHLILQMRTELEDIVLDPKPHTLDFFSQHVANMEKTVEQIIAAEERFPDELSSEVISSVSKYEEIIESHATQLSNLWQQHLWMETQREAQNVAASVIDSILTDCARLIQLEDDEILELAEQVGRQSSAAKAKIIAISTGVIVVSSLIALLLALSITRPIRHLAGVAEKVAAGDLSLRSKIEKNDEIGLLSRSFDKMVTHLERILMEQKLFLTDTSHELLTPVTVIKGHLQVLQRSTGASLEEQKTTYDTVLSELDRIERVLNNLLDLARSTSRDLLNLSSVDLPEFLMNVFKKAEILGKRNWYLGEIPEVKITVDRDLLTGALLNLLRNAVAHTKERDQIALSAHINGRYLQFVVVDTGEGIPEKDIPKIFERFYKGSNSSGGRKPGTGLGLSIVKAVAEVHGGSVSVVSRVGSGSTFYLSIPL